MGCLKMNFNGLFVERESGCGNCKTATSFANLNSSEPFIRIMACGKHEAGV